MATDEVSGEDLDAILEILENDYFEDCLQPEFEEIVKEVEAETREYSCGQCSTVCKTKAGLRRHTVAKHKQGISSAGSANEDSSLPLSIPVFEDIIAKSVKDISEETCFPNEFRYQFIGFSFVLPSKDDDKWKGISELQKLYKNLNSSGNAGHFYSKFYAVVIPLFRNLFSEFSTQGATLLSTRIADKILSHSKHKERADLPAKNTLSSNEKCALQYLGGYVLSKINRKIQLSGKRQSQFGQQCIAFLQAGKTNESTSSHILVDSLSRGGLWKINNNVEQILIEAELRFLELTAIGRTKHIDIPAMVNILTRKQNVKAYYQSWLSSATLQLDQEVSDEMLEKVLTLYLRVRAFSYAKDVVNKFKSKKTKTKSKALRKEIKRQTEKPLIHE